jgi:hypothetical protein
VIAAIEPASAAAYDTRMRSIALRLLTFLAVLLMPFGMSTAPAESHHGHAAAVPMEHCPDGQSRTDGSGLFHSCTMACSATLPAADYEPIDPQPLARTPAEPGFVPGLAGIELEIATPPPRSS